MAQEIKKKDWVSNFNLIGKAKINDYTYKINEKSEKSNWIYNALNLGIDCGEKYGVVYSELMGGYGEDRDNVIYAFGKREEGSDDSPKQIKVDWEDRFNDDVLEEIGDISFITVGLEKTNDGKTYYKKFLSAYDAIAYVKEHLTDGMVVNVRGNLKYSTYNNVTQVRKNITSIALSKAEDSSKYKATFTQSVLIDKDSASLKNVDKAKGVLYVDTKVLDYVKELNGVEIKGQYPFDKQFEFELDLTNQTLCKAIMEKLFKVKKDYTQVTFEGDLIEGGAVVTITLDDVPQDIRELVNIGVYTEEEAISRCSSNGNREHRMVLRKPHTKKVSVGDETVTVLQKFEERYTEEDLFIDLGKSNDEVPFDVDENNPFGNDSSDDDMSWLNAL